MEISPIYHNSRPEGKLPAQEAAAFDFLDSLGIDYERVTHELADTMEKCDDVSSVLGVGVSYEGLEPSDRLGPPVVRAGRAALGLAALHAGFSDDPRPDER